MSQLCLYRFDNVDDDTTIHFVTKNKLKSDVTGIVGSNERYEFLYDVHANFVFCKNELYSKEILLCLISESDVITCVQ